MYSIKYKPSFKKSVKNIKDNKSRNNVKSKIEEIATTLELNPKHYKNLRAPLQEYKRVHVNKNYVILFKVNVGNKEVTFHSYEHHDNVYYKRS